MEPELEELIIPHLPDVLDSLASAVSSASAAAGLAEVNAVHSLQEVLAQWFCRPPDPLTPVAAAHGCEGEGEGQADGEEGQYPLPPRPVHGRIKLAGAAGARNHPLSCLMVAIPQPCHLAS